MDRTITARACAKSLNCALLLSTAILAATPVFAQDVKTENEEDQETLSEDGTLLLGKIVIYADRVGRAVWDVPASISVVDGQEAEAKGQTDMQEITRYVPGVTVPRQTSATDPFSTFSGFTIRGVGGNRVQIQQDGSRVAERITDGTRDYLDFNFTKQVEVVKGPASVLWGADALGGVVAVETIDPEDILKDKDRAGTIDLSYDSLDNETEGTISYAQKFGPDVSLMLGVTRKTANEAKLSNAKDDGGIWGCPRNVDYGATTCGELDPTDIDSFRILAKAVWTPSEIHRLEFTLDHLDRDVSVQYDNSLGPVISMFTGLPTGEIINDYDRDLTVKRTRYAVEHQWSPNTNFIDELKTTIAFVPHSYDRSGSKWATSQSGDTVNTRSTLSYSEEFFELDIQAVSRFTTGLAEHELTWGFDGDYAETEYSRVNKIRNITQGTSDIERGRGFNFANTTTRRADIYIQDKISLIDGALEITPGLRYATYHIKPDPDDDYQAVDGSEPVTRKDDALLFSVGTLYKFDQDWSVWAHYGQGFKMPTAQQLFTSLPGSFFQLVPAPDLRPEEVETYELGIRRQTQTSAIGVSAFHSNYRNFIQSFYNIPNTNKFTYKNLSEVRVWGVELEGEVELNDRLSLSGSAIWQKGNQRAESGAERRTYGLPPLRGTLGLTYDIPQYDVTLDFVGTFSEGWEEKSGDTNFRPDGYAILDAFANWQITEKASLNIGVKNLFDKRYFETGAASYALAPRDSVRATNPLELQTAPGRVFTVSVGMEF